MHVHFDAVLFCTLEMLKLITICKVGNYTYKCISGMHVCCLFPYIVLYRNVVFTELHIKVLLDEKGLMAIISSPKWSITCWVGR